MQNFRYRWANTQNWSSRDCLWVYVNESIDGYLTEQRIPLVQLKSSENEWKKKRTDKFVKIDIFAVSFCFVLFHHLYCLFVCCAVLKFLIFLCDSLTYAYRCHWRWLWMCFHIVFNIRLSSSTYASTSDSFLGLKFITSEVVRFFYASVSNLHIIRQYTICWRVYVRLRVEFRSVFHFCWEYCDACFRIACHFHFVLSSSKFIHYIFYIRHVRSIQ